MSPSSARQFRPGTIIPILPPPAAEPQAQDAVMAGEEIVIHLHDGTRFDGTLQKFLRNEQRLQFSTEGGALQTVPFSSIRLFELPTRRDWVPAKAAGESPGDTAASTVAYRITMKDATTLAGRSLGYRRDPGGLYLYPVHQDNTFTHIFIPRTSTEDQQFDACCLPAAETPAEAPPRHESGETAESGAAKAEAAPAALQSVESPEALEQLFKHHKHTPKLKLGEILVKEQLITQQQLDSALAQQRVYREQGKSMQIGQVLMELGILNLADMLHALSERLGIPFIDLDHFKSNPDSMHYVPEDLVRKYRVLPIHHFGNKLIVALENPMDWEALDAVRFHSKLNVEQVMASREAIDRVIGSLYTEPDLHESLQDYLVDHDDDEERSEEYDESAVQDNVIVKLVNKIIIDAYQQRASDIHIEPYPGKGKTVVRIRKDGALKNYYEVPGKMRNALIARIKIMADLDISEKRKPQDGKIDFRKFGPLKIELRVATIPTTADQEDVVMRILASGEPVPLDKLGLSARNGETIRGLVAKPYGLFLVCGPTGSGKTTTLHSVLGHLNTSDRKIWTAEDPVEITQRGLRQVVVKPKIGLTFAAAMRAFLRADPDIIMVGEMRDKETTSMGIEASLTGHLVLSTLHTNSAPETITRLLDMGMDPFNFADALIGILAQRLTKRLCSECKEAYEPDQEEIDHLVAEYCFELLPRQATAEQKRAVHDQVLEEWREHFTGEDGRFTLHRAKGCSACDDTGYKGRLGIHELLTASELIKKKILEQGTVADLFETAIAEGMRTLKQDGIEKVLQGLTDIHTVRKACIR
jgi:type II secretory ATPase GspE/PulE/Tfp pilus assembly ATPase PilB-like protein